MTEEKKTNPLWTRDFTIITLGSVVSMFGNAMAGFAMSLMVLDISKSTLLYAVYIFMFTLPQVFMPLVSGAVLDRFSRKKTIYSLDFLSAALYVIFAVVIAKGWFSFPLFAAGCFILGSIESIYMVAYESFYPLLITEGNYQKAYSIASVLETASSVMVPVSAFMYRMFGAAPLLALNAACFFIAAVMETRIRAEEEYIEKQKETRDADAGRMRQVLIDMREGFAYLLGEKGLLAVAVYFGFIAFCSGVSNVITLPYFKNTFTNGEFVFMLVWGMGIAGRSISGLVHYRYKIPARYRYGIALLAYITVALCEGFYLFTVIPVMMVLCFINGFGGVTTYTIRISATQSYVPDEKKGRFNGAFNMIFTVGALVGELAAGGLTVVMPERIVLMCAMLLSAAAAVVLIGGNKKEVALIYNREQ